MLRFPAGSLWIPVLLAALSLPPGASPTLAQPLEPPTPRAVDPIGGASYWQGSSDHLPSTPGLSEWHILQHALTMPAVQSLLLEADRRGYVRRPEHDRALIHDQPRTVAAFLALEKPAFSPPPGTNGAPVLQVISVDVYGNPRTTTALTFVLVDEATYAVRTADEEPTMPGDGTLEIHDGWPGGGGRGPRQVHPELTIPPKLRYCGTRFMICSAVGNTACVMQAIYPPGQPWQVKVIRLITCSIFATGACLLDFVDCMSGKQI